MDGGGMTSELLAMAPLRKRKQNDADLKFTTRHINAPDAREALRKAQLAAEGAKAETASEAAMAAAMTEGRVFHEIPYMGSTRAVVGPGFVVRELLFGDECVSLRVTAPATSVNESSLRCASTGGEYRAMLQSVSPLVETLREIEVDAAGVDSSAVAMKGLLVHLKSKDYIAAFQQVVRIFERCLHGLQAEQLRVSPVRQPTCPIVFVRTPIIGNISVTWAAGAATGAAKLFFSSPQAANHFLLNWLDSRVEGLMSGPVELVAQEEAAGLLPLTTIAISESRIVQVYDEEAISQMPATAILRHRFVARISGLPPSTDEASLLKLVANYGCTAADIERVADPQKSQQFDQVTKQLQPLLVGFCAAQNRVVGKHDCCAYLDDARLRASLCVGFTDLSLMTKVHSRLAQYNSFPRPYGQACQVELMYSRRVSIAVDTWEFFRERIAQVRLQAISYGVACYSLSICGSNTHAVYVCRSASIEALDAVVKAFEGAVGCELFVHPILDSLSSTEPRQLEVLQRLESCGTDDVLVKYQRGDRFALVYGAASSRRRALDALRIACFELDAKQSRYGLDQQRTRQCHACLASISYPAALVALTACQHALCLPCIRLQLTVVGAGSLQCPVESCGNVLHVNDVVKNSLDSSMLLRDAVLRYAASNSDECIVCPQSGCNQILSRVAFEFDPHDSAIKYFACDSCKADYCLSCSERTGRAVKRHDGATCA